MLSVRLFLLAAAATAVTSTGATPQYSCNNFFVPISVANITTIIPAIPEFNNTYESVTFTDSLTERDAPSSSGKVKTTQLTATFNISVEYCTPTSSNKSSSIQLLTHGLGFGKKYWDFRLPTQPDNTQYSYIQSALAAGYSTLSYDRLGCGLSPTVNPYTVIQAPVELAILVSLTTLLREGKIPSIPAPSKVLHVGHSYGSVLTVALASDFHTISDGIILTGFSNSFTYAPLFIAGSTFRLASQNQPSRFHNRSSGYVTWADEFANQYSFFEYPYFEPAVLAYAEATKYPVTVGELISQTGLNTTAEAFRGPVLYLAAEHDLIFCGYNCDGNFLGPNSSAVKAFGASAGVEVYIQPNSGHAINLHKNATAAFDVVQGWAKRNGF